MGRRKLPMELIADESARKKSLKVRKECVLKKAHELKTLCGVHDTCVIIYDNQNPNLVTTYPENQDRVKQIVCRYLSANRTVTMKKTNETQKRKLEKKVLDDGDDVIGSLSWEELKSLDDTLAAREVAASRKLEELRRTRMMIRRRQQQEQQQQQQLYNLLMRDDDDGIGEGDMAALNDVMLELGSLI